MKPPKHCQPPLATASNEEGLQVPRCSSPSIVAEPAYQGTPMRESIPYPTSCNPRRNNEDHDVHSRRESADSYCMFYIMKIFPDILKTFLIRIDGQLTPPGSARRGNRENSQVAWEEGHRDYYDSEEDFYDAPEEPSLSQVSYSYSQETFPDHITPVSSSSSAITMLSPSLSYINPSLPRPFFPHPNTIPAGYTPANDVPQGESRTTSTNLFRYQCTDRLIDRAYNHHQDLVNKSQGLGPPYGTCTVTCRSSWMRWLDYSCGRSKPFFSQCSLPTTIHQDYRLLQPYF